MKRPCFMFMMVSATLLLAFGNFSSAQVLIIRSGSTLSLNGNTLNVNCQDILIESGGTLHVGDGTIANAGTITADSNNLVVENGTIEYCEEISISVTVTDTGATVANGGAYVIHHLAAGASQQVQFTITNNGTATVDLLGSPNVVIGGNHPGDVSVVSYPTSSPIASRGTTNFTLEFTAGSDDTRDATVTIEASDGVNQLTYRFTMVANPSYLLWTR